MRRLVTCLVSAGMLAMPAAIPVAAVAYPGQPHVHPFRHHVPRKVARAECRAERTQLGVTAFKAKYGATKALANCVKAKVPSTRAATTTCLAERKALGVTAFRAKYPGGNAIRICVRQATGG